MAQENKNKYVGLDALQVFLDKLEGLFATKTELDNQLGSSHTHDDRYYTESEIDEKLDDKSEITHNHNDLYADINHNHDENYASINHNHEGVYSEVDHNHDDLYAELNHNHDEDYADINHNHDGTYCTPTEVGDMLEGYALANHNHEGVYSEVDHNHNDDYYTKTDIDNKGYLSSIPDEYITETELTNKNYVTESELTEKGYLTSVPSEYVTETELNAKGYLTSVPSEYVTETELATKGYLTSVPSEYITETELNNKGYLTSGSLNGLASTDYVDTKVAGIVNSAPEALNTLNKLASALGNDENFATTVAQQIGEKADKEHEHSEYITETELAGKGYLTSIPDEYITETELNNKGYLTSIPTTEANQLTELWDWYKAETYEVMTGTLSMSPTTSTYEIGSSNDVTFSWTFSKLPTEVTFDGVAQTAAETGSATKTVTSNSHTTKTYSLYGKYVEDETVNISKSISFRNKYYYGCKAIPTTIDNDFIKGLGNSNWATSNTIDFTPNCTSGTYVWYAYPKRLSTSQMWLGGFQGGFESPLTVSVINNSGFTEDYYVYRSVNAGIGSLKVEAK